MVGPELSVVAVSWNTRGCLPAALDSLASACGSRRWEAIVVDNGSEDGSAELLSARSDIRLVRLDRNTGFTHAANVGATEATGERLLFLNPDIVAPPGSIAALVSALDERADAFAAVPWFRNPDGSGQYFWRRDMGWLGLTLCHTRFGQRVDRLLGGPAASRRRYAALPDPPGRMPLDAAGAACLLLRRDEFWAEGGFDERYFNFFQDTDLYRRLRRDGRILLGVGDIEVTHQMGVSFRDLPKWEYDAQYLYALRQYLAGESALRRGLTELMIRLDLHLPRDHGPELRSLVLRPTGAPRRADPGARGPSSP